MSLKELEKERIQREKNTGEPHVILEHHSGLNYWIFKVKDYNTNPDKYNGWAPQKAK